MDPIAFERLCQRLLRESGFIEVEVTKRSGDGGIDGYGTIRLGGLITGGITLEARREATRDGAPPLDLIDGRLLTEKLRELKLGVRTTVVEHVEVVEDWFHAI